MANIILQHFDGDLRPLDELSIENIKAYAKMVGAEYELVRGKPFRENLTAPCQKVYMIDERYDIYDDVLMLDIDMFAPKGMTDNVFEEKGCGLHAEVQTMLAKKLKDQYPMISDLNKPYWGGAIYKFDRNTRQRFRDILNAGSEAWMNNYNRPYHFEDEGIFHTLTVFGSMYFAPGEMYLNRRWCQCSFLPYPEKAGFIHIRTKVTPQGPKREKIENYQALVDKGIL
jgi:hypothetical protein